MFSIFLWNYVRKIRDLRNNMIYSLKQVVKELFFFILSQYNFIHFFQWLLMHYQFAFLKKEFIINHSQL